MKEKCRVCNAELVKPLFSTKVKSDKKNFKFYKCQKCQTLQIRPLLSKKKLEKVYFHKNIHGDFLKNNQQAKLFSYLPFFNSLFRFYTKMICQNRKNIVLSQMKKGTILDIGFGDAKFLEILNNKNWHLHGVEINKDMTRSAAKKLKKAKLTSKDIYSTKFKKDFFDVITMWHVFEHLTHPRKSITTISQWLKKDGFLIIEVPNANSLFLNLFGKNWQQLIVPEHQFLFQKKSFEELFKKNNLKIEKVRYLGFASFGPPSSFANFLRSKKINSTLSSLIAIALYPAFVFIAFLLFSKRENLQIIARKT